MWLAGEGTRSNFFAKKKKQNSTLTLSFQKKNNFQLLGAMNLSA